MNNLSHVIDDLNGLAKAYTQRFFDNEIDNPSNPYLYDQANRFRRAAEALEEAVKAAVDHALTGA